MDIAILLWLQTLRETGAPAVHAFFSFLASDAVLVLVLVAPCLAYWCLDRRRGLVAIAAYGMSWLSNQAIKNTVCCYRPWVRDARIMPEASAIASASGYSFPSGHTQSSASLAGGLGWEWREHRWPLALAVAFTLLMGFSRMYLSVHTPQDVLVGLVEGCLFVALATRVVPWMEADPARAPHVVAGCLVADAVFLAYVTLKPYPMDYVASVLLVDPADMLVDCYKAAGGFAGIALGWLFERRFVRFGTDGLTRRQMVLRLLVGSVVVLVLYKPVGHLLAGLLGRFWGQLLRHLIALGVAVGVVPLMFGTTDRLASPQERAA